MPTIGLLMIVRWAASAGGAGAVASAAVGDAAAGAEVYRLRLALAAANHRAAWVPVPPAVLAELVQMPTGAATLGMIAIGPAPV